MNALTAKFFEINRFATDRKLLWIQGPGGNTSFKSGEKLFIKPSGARLDQLHVDEDLAEVLLPKFREFFNEAGAAGAQDKERLYKDAVQNSSLRPSKRPSMETGFHALLPKTFVVHVHSVFAVLLAEELEHRSVEFETWFDANWRLKLGAWTVVEPLMPGMTLAQEIVNRGEFDILFLRNHGVILQFNERSFLEMYAQFEVALARDFLRLETQSFEPEKLRSGPMKFYFPDSVILADRIYACLEKDRYGFRFVEGKETKDLDAWENWQATQFLFRANPRLRELPAFILDEVNSLPTEIERKKVMKT